MSITLAELKSEPVLANKTSWPSAALSGVWSTLSLLCQSSRNLEQIAYLAPYLSLVPSSSTHMLNSTPFSEGDFIEKLTRAAHLTSASLACSSVLAGLSSESDQFGDVGILFPVLGGDKETEILHHLGLAHWLDDGGKIVKSHVVSGHMPSGLAHIPPTQRAVAASQLDTLTSLLTQLHDPFEFRLESGQGNGGTVIWLFMGTITFDSRTVLGGLLGAGTWGDF